jgi:hypothetical protein
MTRGPGIVAVALVLLAGTARAAPAERASVPADESPGLAQSLAVQAAPVPEREPPPGDQAASPASLEQLPLESRTRLLLYVGDHVPGVVAVDGGLSIHGAEARETALYVDDARASRLVLPLGMLDRLSVLTAGYGAPLADVTGGAIAATTASETRSLSLDVGHARELGRHNDDVTSLAVGTPLVRDRLWLRVAADLQLQRLDGPQDPAGFFPASPDVTQRTGRAAAKLIWLPGADHHLELLAAGSFDRQDGIATVGVAPDAQPRYESGDLALSARWAAALGRRLTGRLQLYGERNRLHEQPLSCVPAGCFEPATIQTFPVRYVWGSWTRDSEIVQRAIELVAAVAAPLPGTDWLRPSLRLGTRARASDQHAALSVPGDSILEYQGMVPLARTEYYSNDPRLAGPTFGWVRRQASALRAVQSLEVPLALFSRAQIVPSLALVSARAHTGRGDRLVQTGLAPGVSASWQVLQRLPLVMRASSMRRVDTDLELVTGGSLSSLNSRYCGWNDQTGTFDRECTYNGGDSGWSLGLPCSPAGVDDSGQPCRAPVRFPRSWENTAGVGVNPVPGLRADLDLVHRRSDGLWQTAETNRIWNQAGTALAPSGGFRNGRPQTVMDVSTLASAKRRHRSLHSTLTATPGPLVVTLAHVHSVNTTTSASLSGPVEWDDGGRHFIHGAAAADLRGYFSVGALYTYAQGPIYTRRFRNVVTGQSEDYRAQVGANPGANINDPASARVLRLPSTQQLSLQLRARGRRLLAVDADLFVDLMQVLQSLPSGATADGPLFGQPADTGPDSWFRIGLEYRY